MTAGTGQASPTAHPPGQSKILVTFQGFHELLAEPPFTRGMSG